MSKGTCPHGLSESSCLACEPASNDESLEIAANAYVINCESRQSITCPSCCERFWPSCAEGFKAGASYGEAKGFIYAINKTSELEDKLYHSTRATDEVKYVLENKIKELEKEWEERNDYFDNKISDLKSNLKEMEEAAESWMKKYDELKNKYEPMYAVTSKIQSTEPVEVIKE